MSIEERFWNKVDKSGDCWLWTAATSDCRMRYGKFGINSKKVVMAHRYSYELANGKIPEGLKVCHKCDIPLCVNPDHLFLGNHQDNADDRKSKGRSASKEGHGRVKLSQGQVDEIRKVHESISQTELGKRYGVSRTQIRRILRGESWS